MILFLRRNQQAFIIFTILYGILFVISAYFSYSCSHFNTFETEMPFFPGIVIEPLLHHHTCLLFSFLLIPVVLFIGFYHTRISIKYLIISSRSQFPAIFFLAISVFAFKEELFSGAVVACILLLFSIDRLFGSVEQKGLSYRFFDAGLVLGIAGIFYFNIIFLFPFFLLTQAMLRRPNWRELLFVFIGMLTPFFYIVLISFLFDYPVELFRDRIVTWMASRKTIESSNYFLAFTGGYLLILFITSLFALRKFTTNKIITRKYYQLLFILFLNLLLIFILIPSTGAEIFYLLAIPASIPLSIYFTGCRPNFFNRVLLLLVLSAPVLYVFLH